MSEQLQNDKGSCRIWHDTTKLIEHYGFFEGVAAWCLGMPINQVRPGNKPRPKLHELPLAKLRACGDQAVRVGEHQLRCSGFLDIILVRLTKMKIQDVRYRSILSEKLENLPVADRCIAATQVAASAAKSMGNCTATGHAAGLAAAMSAKKRCLPRELRISQMQEALRADGVGLDRGGDDQDNPMNTS